MKCPNCGKEIAYESQFCEFCGAPINQSIDDILLNIIEVSSHNTYILGAYKARSKCYKLCKAYSPRPDYKEYVQHLQLQHYPNEYKKSLIEGRYYIFLWVCVIIGLVSLFFAVLGWIVALSDDDALWMAIPATVILGIAVMVWIREYKRCAKSIENFN